MKLFKYLLPAILLAITFSACKKEEDEITLTPDGEVAIDNSLVGVWKLTYDDYSVPQDTLLPAEDNNGTEGEITITITADGTIISENEYISYEWTYSYEDTSSWWNYGGIYTWNVEVENEYEIQKFETSNIASNRMKINGLPFYWSVYEDDNDDEILYLDITDIYNEIKGSQHDYMIFPNTGFLKQ